MRRVIVICEGPTEQEFLKDVLASHLWERKIMLQTPSIKKSGGGMVHWDNLRKQIQTHLSQDTSASVSTLVDFYGIGDKHGFPSWKVSKAIKDPFEKLDFIEDQMKQDIGLGHNDRFIPYVQLHEFEGLLFSDLTVIADLVSKKDLLDAKELSRLIKSNLNPELVNDNPNSTPSRRLAKLIRGYNKIVYGSIFASSIGLKGIRKRSTRFHRWISRLENI